MCHQYWPTSGIQKIGEYTVDLIGEEKLEGFVLRTLSVVEGKVCSPSAHSQVHFPPPAQSLGMRLQSYSPPLRLSWVFLDIGHRLNHNYVSESI